MNTNKSLKKVARIFNKFILGTQDELRSWYQLVNKKTCGARVYDYVDIEVYQK